MSAGRERAGRGARDGAPHECVLGAQRFGCRSLKNLTVCKTEMSDSVSEGSQLINGLKNGLQALADLEKLGLLNDDEAEAQRDVLLNSLVERITPAKEAMKILEQLHEWDVVVGDKYDELRKEIKKKHNEGKKVSAV